jgi:hypothetical protein
MRSRPKVVDVDYSAVFFLKKPRSRSCRTAKFRKKHIVLSDCVDGPSFIWNPHCHDCGSVATWASPTRASNELGMYRNLKDFPKPGSSLTAPLKNFKIQDSRGTCVSSTSTQVAATSNMKKSPDERLERQMESIRSQIPSIDILNTKRNERQIERWVCNYAVQPCIPASSAPRGRHCVPTSK